ncbi:hypothetical protein ACFY36_01310 [Actinoplanes sp. NPDC000266]
MEPNVGHWRLVGGRRGLMLLPARRPQPWFTPEPRRPGPREAAKAGPPVGRPTPAGWSFVPFAEGAPARPPVIGFFVVDVGWDPGGFEIEGQRISPALFAAHLAALATARPILLAPHRPEGSPAASRRILIELCQALGRPVTTAEGTVRFAADGTASTDGVFRRWHPAPRPAEDVGSILPGPAFAYTGDAKPRPPRPEIATSPGPAIVDKGWAELLRVSTWTASSQVVEPRRPVPLARDAVTAAPAGTGKPLAPAGTGKPLAPAGTEQPLAPAGTGKPLASAGTGKPLAPAASGKPLVPAAPAAVPPRSAEPPTGFGSGLWLPDADSPVDLAAVRETLGRSYDAHARVVTRLLSENPGLRAVAGPSTAATAGLVAVRSYLLDEHATLNAALRGETAVDEAAAARALLLAVTAQHGLVRLPSVFGPVFRNLPADPEVTVAYRPGEELEEPGFVDVDLVPASGEDVAIEFAIWSTSAHRVGGLGAGESAALFPPGSRFSVLAVDEPADRAAPVRVLLRDLATTGRNRVGPENVDRVVTRLREVRPSGVIRPVGRSGFPIGVDRQQRRFRRGAPAHPRPSGSGTAIAERMERA